MGFRREIRLSTEGKSVNSLFTGRSGKRKKEEKISSKKVNLFKSCKKIENRGE